MEFTRIRFLIAFFAFVPLSDANIASLRYDKRLIGDSASASLTEADLRFDMYVADAGARIAFVDEMFDLPVFVIGHSEGSLIGMLAAESTKARGVISIAGPGQRASSLILEKVPKQLPPDLLAQSEEIIHELEEVRLVMSPPPVLNALFPGECSAVSDFMVQIRSPERCVKTEETYSADLWINGHTGQAG